MPLTIEGTTYYTTAEAAVELGLSQAAVRYAIARGTLEHAVINPRLNMVSRASIERYRRERLGQAGRPPGRRNKPKVSPTAPDDATPPPTREGDR